MVSMLAPKVLLSKLTPTKSIMCLVCKPATFGLALSDPYLSCARPLRDVSSQADVERAAAEHNVGALAFALPMRRHTNVDDGLVVLAERSASLGRQWLGVTLCCTIDDRLTLDQALAAKLEEMELWEDIDLDDGTLSTDAAVALNHFLFEHCGGWRNTFG